MSYLVHNARAEPVTVRRWTERLRVPVRQLTEHLQPEQCQKLHTQEQAPSQSVSCCSPLKFEVMQDYL